MLDACPLMAFIAVTDFDVSRAFYTHQPGLHITDENPFAIVLDAGGTMLRLTQVSDLHPQPFTIAGWQVPNIGDAVDALTSAGITFTRYEGIEQDAKGIWATPGGDFVAWFKDPDGNTRLLTSFGGPPT